MAGTADLVSGYDLGIAICEALNLEANMIERIIIDISAYTPVHVYIEMVASRKILAVDWSAGLGSAEITILDEG